MKDEAVFCSQRCRRRRLMSRRYRVVDTFAMGYARNGMITALIPYRIVELD